MCAHAASLLKLEERFNLHSRKILTNLCLYIFKHLVHPVNLFVVVILFHFFYGLSIFFTVKGPLLL
jgi:hypothetical protein